MAQEMEKKEKRDDPRSRRGGSEWRGGRRRNKRRNDEEEEYTEHEGGRESGGFMAQTVARVVAQALTEAVASGQGGGGREPQSSAQVLRARGGDWSHWSMGAWEHGIAWARKSTKVVWFVLGTSWRERRERGLSDSDLAERPTDGTLSSTAHSSQRGLTWLAQGLRHRHRHRRWQGLTGVDMLAAQ